MRSAKSISRGGGSPSNGRVWPLINTNWFCRWLQNRPGPKIEPDFRIETAADLNCTPNGSLRYSH